VGSQRLPAWAMARPRFRLNFSDLWRPRPEIYLHRGYLQETMDMRTKGPNSKCLFCWKRLNRSDRLNYCSVFSNRQWSLPRSIVYRKVSAMYVQGLMFRYVTQGFVEIRPVMVSYRPVSCGRTEGAPPLLDVGRRAPHCMVI
jgi:hypothetical protein